ncbi:hypothetical protein V8G54_025397 [Vigna mungo]|uniref:RecA family profile 1 domain-containing protein n=1 Tax=Vigna mungo TaxID=3915 RepID=A0AAQ3RNA7_VIGMU
MRPDNLLLLNHYSEKCNVGCPVLDRCLNGGVPCHSITDFVGESGSGKTQLCLQIALFAQLPSSHGGLSTSSIFIHTEFHFPFRRLHQLSGAFRTSHPDLPDPYDSVFVRVVHFADELLHLIPTIETLCTLDLGGGRCESSLSIPSWLSSASISRTSDRISGAGRRCSSESL